MNNDCVMCGISIPNGQENCSMCYGDPYYGNDGYYLEFLRAHEAEALAEQQWWEELELEE